jgi:Ca2+-binding EF-hand superfamily protein
MTYDLDNDGYVSNQDYYVSKLHDKNNKGKLTESEREQARNY